MNCRPRLEAYAERTPQLFCLDSASSAMVEAYAAHSGIVGLECGRVGVRKVYAYPRLSATADLARSLGVAAGFGFWHVP